MHYPADYPATASGRDRFVIDRRDLPDGRPLDASRYQDLIVEDERTADGRIARVGTILLTGRECPWRCVMCDLWRRTTPDDTPRGAIPAQLAAARHQLRQRGEHVTQMKLYNAGSFFDPRAVPDEDYDGIAGHLAAVERVIVESHPALVGPRVDRFIEALAGHAGESGSPPQLEIAMGLETAHPDALDGLNKRMTVNDFVRAADLLRQRKVSVRAFLLISPPGVPDEEQDAWLCKSVDIAFASGATVVSLVPTRGGNGALEALTDSGAFREPRLGDIERSVDVVFSRAPSSEPRVTSPEPRAARVFVDLWDLERFSDCATCFDARRCRLHTMNLEQRELPPISCERCGS
jgi:radical SAM enzyme (TIGR01210 family)